jgi:hypothetical protein
MVVPSYDWKITAMKFIKQFLLVAILAGILWAIEEGVPGLIAEYPVHAATLSLASAILVALYNYIRHYKDTEEIPA